MRCDRIQGLLPKYIEGSLNRALKETVESHLQHCADCRQGYGALRVVWQALPQLPAPEPPDWLHERIMARVEAYEWNQRRQPRPMIFGWRLAAIAGAAILLFLLGYFSAQPGRVISSLIPWIKHEPRPAPPPPVIPKKILKIEWRPINGQSVPVFVAAELKSVAASLAWSAEIQPDALLANPHLLWQGQLEPGHTLEMPLSWIREVPREEVDAVVLWWTVNGDTRAFFVPTEYPSHRATIRLRETLGEALLDIAAEYRMVIEWKPASQNPNPLVVLDVKNTDAGTALSKLLEGTSYQLTRTERHWVIKAR